MEFKDDHELRASPVVANCRMNRERELTGGNSYARDLGFDPVEFLLLRLKEQPAARWLDLCCGRGRALIEAARQCVNNGSEIEIIGVDLVGMFDRCDLPNLTLVEAAIQDWEPAWSFDLITCVHGLHYVGDKLGAIRRAASWLTESGTFVAHCDPQNVRHAGYRDFGRVVVGYLRQSGIDFDSRNHRVKCIGQQEIDFPWTYLGADDDAGPNFTGQPAVNSWYMDSET